MSNKRLLIPTKENNMNIPSTYSVLEAIQLLFGMSSTVNSVRKSQRELGYTAWVERLTEFSTIQEAQDLVVKGLRASESEQEILSSIRKEMVTHLPETEEILFNADLAQSIIDAIDHEDASLIVFRSF